ncbi:MAG: putative sugar nucleotidyl transferase [Flavitalea sp.]
MSILLNDTTFRSQLYPFAETRSVADIRVGILTIRQKWELVTKQQILTTSELGHSRLTDESDNQVIPANLVPSQKWITDYMAGNATLESLTNDEEVTVINHPWDIFKLNDQAIRQDFKLLTQGRGSQPIPETVQVSKSTNIFIEEGAQLSFCTLNASTGPIYIGKNAEIMEGTTIRGPFALGDGSTIKMGTRIYGATSIGPNCVVGGEIKNVVMFAHSNKGHDGYLGDSVIGEWCNLGAGTSNSNLKNNAGDVKVWNEHEKGWTNAGSKCGLLMGDFSRAAINTSFNTGSVVGICANIFGSGFVPKHVPSFSWGTDEPGNYSFEKAMEHIINWKKLKKQSLSETEIQRLKHIFEAVSKD